MSQTVADVLVGVLEQIGVSALALLPCGFALTFAWRTFS